MYIWWLPLLVTSYNCSHLHHVPQYPRGLHCLDERWNDYTRPSNREGVQSRIHCLLWSRGKTTVQGLVSTKLVTVEPLERHTHLQQLSRWSPLVRRNGEESVSLKSNKSFNNVISGKCLSEVRLNGQVARTGKEWWSRECDLYSCIKWVQLNLENKLIKFIECGSCPELEITMLAQKNNTLEVLHGSNIAN